MVSRYPGRFVAVAAVDLAHPVAALRELRRCVRDLGFRAPRVVPWLWNMPPSDRRYYPLYAECVELGFRSASRPVALQGVRRRCGPVPAGARRPLAEATAPAAAGELFPPGGTAGLILLIAHLRLGEPERVAIGYLATLIPEPT